MSDERLPSVDVLMPAYNYGHYVERALRSALEQDYPAELLRIIVVDDGSTDDTAAVVANLVSEYPQRVLLIRQVNSGPSAAINRALREAQADLIAVLDADDIWLPTKTRRQAARLAADPALGLVFCDMRVVDGEERLVRPSQVGHIGQFPRRALAQLLCQNVVTQSSLMIRREFARELPAGVPYSDWWFAICAAECSELEYISEPLALYREHGANLTSGVSGASGVREHRKEIAFQLWALRNLDLSSLSPAEVGLVWGGVEQHAARAFSAAGSNFVELVTVTESDREHARAALAQADRAASAGESELECVLLLKALGWDPGNAAVLERFPGTIARAQAAAAAPDPLAGARGFITLVKAEELLAGDELLLAYKAAMSGITESTLAIDASALPPERAAADLQALVERCGLTDANAVDLLAVVGELDERQRRRMLARANALYRRKPEAQDADGALPVFTADSAVQLRALAKPA